jgi:hypothetical protein
MFYLIFPATGSPTTTLLRLHHSYESYYHKLTLNFTQIESLLSYLIFI